MHSAGFAELGGDGVVAQAEITSLCRQAGIGLIGPNCIGMVSFPSRVCLSGATVPIEQRAGPVGFVTQSGAIGILAMHTGRHLRFSHIVSTGNEAVITAEDVIRWLVEDPHTQVIGAFIEQIRNPDEFVAVAGAARAADKPIVMLKTGRSDAGGRAALSHTRRAGRLGRRPRCRVSPAWRDRGRGLRRAVRDPGALLDRGGAPEGAPDRHRRDIGRGGVGPGRHRRVGGSASEPTPASGTGRSARTEPDGPRGRSARRSNLR